MDKVTVNSLNINGVSSPSKRHCILSALTDSGGYNAMLTESTGQITLNASSTPCNLTWAAGFENGVEKNYFAEITSNQSPAGWDLSSENDGTYYLYIDNDGDGNLTYGNTIKAPVYDYAFPWHKHALIKDTAENFYTTTAWTLGGNATVQSATKKFGTDSIYCDGTGDYIQSNDGLQVGNNEGWTVECWVNTISFANYRTIFSIGITNSYGIHIYINASGYLLCYAGNFGGDWNIWNGVTTSTAQMSVSTWHHVALDFTGSALSLYVDGTRVLTSSQSFVSTCYYNESESNRVIRFGGSYINTNWMYGYFDDIRITDGFSRYQNATSFTPPTSTFTADSDFNFFSIPDMKMYVGGGDGFGGGSWTATNRLFVGQVNKSSSTYTVTNYAIQGKYISPITHITPVNTSFADNIGTTHKNMQMLTRASSAYGWTTTDKYYVGGYYGFNPTIWNKNILYVETGSAIGHENVTGVYAFPSVNPYTNGEIKLIVERSF